MKKLIALLVVLVSGAAAAATVCVKLPTPVPTYPPGSATVTLGGVEYVIRDHPRFTNPGRLSVLRGRAVTGKTLWDSLVTFNGTGSGCEALEFAGNRMFNWAVGYLADPTKTAWRDCAISHMNKIQYLDPAVWDAQRDYGSIMLQYWSLTYDIVQADMTDAMRTNFRNYVFATWLPWMYGHAYNHRSTTGDCHLEPTHNLCITKWFGEYTFGMSCMGEDARCDDLVEYNYEWYRTTSNANYSVKPLLDQVYVGCHSFSGSDYGKNRYVPYLMEMADEEENALGMTSWMAWMDECPTYNIHSQLPRFTKAGCLYYGASGDKCSYYNSEFYPGAIVENQGRSRRQMLLPIERNPNGTYQKIAQDWLKNYRGVSTAGWTGGKLNESHVNNNANGYGGKEYLGEYFLRFNQDGASSVYTSLPTTYGARGLGIVYSRDAWGDDDKFWMVSNASAFIKDHQTTGSGSFKLFKNGEFGVVENDRRYAGGGLSQTMSAGYVQNILMMGTGMVGTTLTGGFPTWGYDSNASLEKFSYGDTWAAWQANLDEAYQTTSYPMSYVRRNFVHFKPISGSPNFVVLIDAVAPTNSITVKQFVHVPNNSPTLSDPLVTSTLANTRTLIKRIYGDALTVDAVTDGSAVSDCIQCGSGMSRVVNSSAAATYHLLGLVLSMQGTSGTMPTTTAINGASGQLVGVLIADTIPKIALVSKDDQILGAATFTFTASPAASPEIVISGLTAGTKYDYSVGGSTHTLTLNQSTGALTVDADGVLYRAH